MKKSLDSLPAELLAIIVEDLHDFPDSILALALTCKRLSAWTQPLVNRHRTIDLWSKVPKIVKIWLRNPVVRTETRQLTIVRPKKPGKKRQAKRDAAAHAAIVKLVSRLQRLDTLCWNVGEPLPLTILDALHQHQKQAELSVRHFVRANPNARHLDDFERALAASPALTCLREYADVTSLEGPAHEAFREIVMRAPNIRDVVCGEFDVTVPPVCGWSAGEWHRGQTMRQKTQQRLAAQFPKDIRLNPSVRSLCVSGPRASLGDWEKTILPENLESISIDLRDFSEDTFHRVLGTMPMLREISAVLPNWMQNIEQRALYGTASQEELDRLLGYKRSVTSSLTACQNLVSLCLIEWMSVVDLQALLTYHGSTLKRLNLHMREKLFAYGEDPRPMISLVDLGHVKELCPHLTDLGIDFTLASARPARSARDDILGCLSTMRLRRVDLYLGSELNSINSAAKASSVNDFVLATFRRLFAASSPATGGVYHELNVITRNFELDYIDLRHEILGWLAGTRMQWTARSTGRDDCPGEAVLVKTPTWDPPQRKGWRRSQLLRRLAQIGGIS